MRVSVVTTSYPSHPGDPAGHFVEAEVRELERDGHAVTVHRPSPGRAFGWPGAATRIRAQPLRAIEASAWMLRTAREIRNAAPEHIVAHWCLPSAWPIAFSAPDVPLEIVSHGGDIRLLAAMPTLLREELALRLARRATRWRFVSQALFDGFLQALPGVADEVRRIATVAPSLLAMIDVSDAARQRRKALGERRLYVCAGRLVPSKRIDRVIDYVANQRRENPVLVVLGDGPERARLEKIARAWQLDVRFHGTTPRDETLVWIGAADEVVHASRAEGLSTVVREAEHLGVPVTFL